MRRWLLRILASILVLFALFLIFISPICEWVVESYSEEYIGRKVLMEDLGINLLMGTIRIDKLEIREQNSDKNWLTCTEISAGIHSGKLISGSYVVPEITVDGLKTTVIQTGEHFNFDDLLNLPQKYAQKEVQVENEEEPTEWLILNVSLLNTELRYVSPDYGIDYTASDIRITCPQMAWNDSKMHFEYGFGLNTGGRFDGQYSIDLNDLEYNLELITKNLKLDAAKPYLDEFISLQEFSGFLETNLHLTGNHNRPEDLTVGGSLGVNSLRCIDTYNATIASVELLSIGVDSIDIRSNFYDFGEILIKRPMLQFELYKEGDNWSRLMASSSEQSTASDSSSSYSNPFVLLANYIRTYVKDYVVSDYYADRILLQSGKIDYTDYTLHDIFHCELDSMQLSIDRLNTDSDRLKMNFYSSINESGKFETDIAINPRDYQDMECHFDFKDLPATMFNPYMTYYVATPFTYGKISFDNTITISTGILNALNTLYVEQPKTGSKVKNETAMKLPVKLAISLLKNVDGNIDLEIPVEGNLNDPEYKLRKAIWSVVKNLLLKAVQAPGKLLAKVGGNKEENLQEILITYGLAGFTSDQKDAIGKMAKPLIIKPELNISFTQNTDYEDEMNALILLEARKQYVLSKGMILPDPQNDQSIYDIANQMSIQDSMFVAWLDIQSNSVGKQLATTDKCRSILQQENLELLLTNAHAQREKELRSLLVAHGVADQRIQFIPAEKHALPPGDIPRFTYELNVDESKSE